MDQIRITDSNEANAEFGSTCNSVLNPAELNCSDFSNAVDNSTSCDNENDKNESTEESPNNFVDVKNLTSARENDILSMSCAKNEVTENGDDSLVAEKNLTDDLVKNIEKDDLLKKENVSDCENGDKVIDCEILNSDHRSNCVPSAVKIRGGCSDVFEQADQSSSTPLYDVSSFTPSEDNKIVVDLSTEPESSNNVLDKDCVHTGTEHCKTSFSNTFPSNEEKIVNSEVEDPVVICDETASKLPSPVPTKVKSNKEAVSQSNSGRTENHVATKRFTRSSLTKVNDCIIPSSSSGKESVPDSKKRNQLPKNAANASAGDSCNEHTTQHRNRAEEKAQNRSKATKQPRLYSCDICQKELSTSQSLQQHVLIHENVKPFECHVCQKDFRHLSNYRMHMQKHKTDKRHRDETQQTDGSEQLDKNAVRKADSGRQVDSVFTKERSVHRELDTSSSTSRRLRSATSSFIDLTKKTASKPLHSPQKASTKPPVSTQKVPSKPLHSTQKAPSKPLHSTQKAPSKPLHSTQKAPSKPLLLTKKAPSSRPQLSFDQPAFKIGAKSTSSISSAVVIRKRVLPRDSVSEEECMVVKSFENVESVKMNTSQIIVNSKNFNTRALKRKLLTPDISIDEPPRKSKVRLSSIARKCDVKLDEIENIPMDADPPEIDLLLEEIEGDQFVGYPNKNNGIETAGDSTNPPLDTLSDSELFSLLNDDKDTSTATTISANSAGDASSRCSSQILLPEDGSTAKIVVPDIDWSDAKSEETALSYEMNGYEDEKADDGQFDDPFDAAFQKVATRRLALLQRRAVKNGGKVESRYRLGPLFWHKALRRAQEDVSAVGPGRSDTSDAVACDGRNNGSYIGNSLEKWALQRFGGRSRFDVRRSNDPIELQSRAETKFKCLLERAKRAENANALNLAGPLFWRRTLRLAGVYRGEDLRTVTNVAVPTLEGVEFVSDDGTACELGADQGSAEERKTPQPSPLDPVSESDASSESSNHNDQLPGDGMSPSVTSELSDEISSLVAHAEQQFPGGDEAATENVSNDIVPVKTDAILVESVTEPIENQGLSVVSDDLSPSDVHCGDVSANPDNTAVSFCNSSLSELPENHLTDLLKNDFSGLTSDATTVSIDDCRLSGVPVAGQNLVLVSDESGTQYVINLSNGSDENFGFIGDGGCGDQVSFAIQFDGENYTAVQFVQNGDGLQLQSDGGLEALQVDSKAATCLVSNVGAPAMVSDPSQIGKELSDFLTLNYSNVLNDGTTEQ